MAEYGFDMNILLSVLGKYQMRNVDVGDVKALGDILIVKIRSNIDCCPLCKRIHDNENMFCIVNPRSETIEIRCFRRNQKERGIKLTFKGVSYISEYDVSNGMLYEDAIQTAQADDRGIDKKVSISALRSMIESYTQSHHIQS